MIRYSILIPERNAGSELARQLPELRRVLDLLSLPYEVICIDASSGPATRAALAQLMRQHACLRVLTLDRAAGLGIGAGRRHRRRSRRAGRGYRAGKGISGRGRSRT